MKKSEVFSLAGALAFALAMAAMPSFAAGGGESLGSSNAVRFTLPDNASQSNEARSTAADAARAAARADAARAVRRDTRPPEPREETRAPAPRPPAPRPPASAKAKAAPGKGSDIESFDPNMAVETGKVAGGFVWIDGKNLPIEGRAFNDTEEYYDRLPAKVTDSVNAGVRSLKRHTAGMQFRFTTDSKKLVFKWVPRFGRLAMDHMPATGVSGIDVYQFDAKKNKWVYVKTGRISNANLGSKLVIPWTPGTPCLVNLPLYNGLKSFELGIEPGTKVTPLPPRKSGVTKPVVFYGTSITQGGCASRPGMSFVNIIGRELDVPVVNLGFSGSGAMELEMSEHLAKIDASCYVLDCLWNMSMSKPKGRAGWNVDENYEPFIRNLRAKRPNVPIIMAGACDVYGGKPNDKDDFVRKLYDKLIAGRWRNLYYLPKDGMFLDDGEGTVDGLHPNDWGMMAMAEAYGAVVRKALGLREDKRSGGRR